MFTADDHTFAVCAYGESPYLTECIASLRAQTVPSRIIVCTSTPNAAIEAAARDNDLPLFVSGEEPGIGHDWNYALSCAETPLVTIAHQDDVYCADYAGKMLAAMNACARPLIFFSDYGELREGERVDDNELLNVKRSLLRPFERASRSDSRFWKRHILRFGSAISCPSVTYNEALVPVPLFDETMKCDLDWQAWERLSREAGSFCYRSEILMYHRIHEDSETTHLINDNTRTQEDLQMLKMFWPSPIAHAINAVYGRSQKSNG